jgi:hypothetical protein
MITEMKPEKVKSSTASLLQLVRRHARTEGEAGDIAAFVILALSMSDSIGEAWTQVVADLDKGSETEPIRAACAALAIAADSWLELASALQAAGVGLPEAPDTLVPALTDLIHLMPRMKELRSQARKVVDSINLAYNERAIPAGLTESGCEYEGIRFVKGQDVIARLRSRR